MLDEEYPAFEESLWQELYAHLRGGIVAQQRAHAVHLVNHHRHKEIADKGEKEQCLKERDEYRRHAPAEMQEAPVVLHEGLEHIGDETCHTEWQQHAFENVYEPYYPKQKRKPDEHTHHAIKCVGLTVRHNVRMMD